MSHSDDGPASPRPLSPSSPSSASTVADMRSERREATADTNAAATNSDGKPAPTLHLDAHWPVHTREYTFTPLLHSPALAAWTRYRHYNVCMMAVMVGWGLLVFQPFLKGWGQVGLMIAFETLLILPVCFIECTRIDRNLFVRLVASFDWLWLIGNHIVANVMRMLIAKHQPSTTGAELAYLGCVYVVWLQASLYAFSLDALVGPSHRFRIVWMFVFILQVLQFYIQYQLARNDTLDLEICAMYCSTAQSLLSASMLNVMIFSSKYCLSLIRNPQCLMIIGPRCKLTVEGGEQTMAEEQQQRTEETLNPSLINEMQTLSSSAQL